jgi:hypothetical protein
MRIPHRLRPGEHDKLCAGSARPVHFVAPALINLLIGLMKMALGEDNAGALEKRHWKRD